MYMTSSDPIHIYVKHSMIMGHVVSVNTEGHIDNNVNQRKKKTETIHLNTIKKVKQ